MNADKELAIQNATTYKEGASYSDGNMVLGSAVNHVAVSFNNTTYNQNQLLILQQRDAVALFALLLSAGRKHGWIS